MPVNGIWVRKEYFGGKIAQGSQSTDGCTNWQGEQETCAQVSRWEMNKTEIHSVQPTLLMWHEGDNSYLPQKMPSKSVLWCYNILTSCSSFAFPLDKEGPGSAIWWEERSVILVWIPQVFAADGVHSHVLCMWSSQMPFPMVWGASWKVSDVSL